MYELNVCGTQKIVLRRGDSGLNSEHCLLVFAKGKR